MIVGYNLCVYNACLKLYKEMYEWDEKAEGNLLVFLVEAWAAIPLVIMFIAAALISSLNHYFVYFSWTSR